MDQERIGKFIKEVRTKDKLSQEKFGEKYGVTYQAVSKWENGKNIPDIAILKEICKDYNKDINELLDNNSNFKKKSNERTVLIVISLIILASILSLIFIQKKDSDNNDGFEFKKIKTTCDDFQIFGSIAYDKNKTSIYISNIDYCGEENNTIYKEIECSFYEVDGKIKNEIDSYKYDKEITLNEFLDDLKFNVDHYSDTCKMYKENALTLEIKATDKNNKITFYSIPLELEDNC